jgi:hypothetical protein
MLTDFIFCVFLGLEQQSKCYQLHQFSDLIFLVLIIGEFLVTQNLSVPFVGY